jgi:hypothetical protein
MGNRKQAATLLAGLAAFCGLLAGVASAGNPHGTPPGQAQAGNGNGNQSSQPPGQEKKQQASSADAQPTTADNSTGVKPSSTTQHQTTAAAGSNKTKRYGNGKTAGQIAMKNGASANTTLYGPGNSQPHKAAVCSKNGKTHQVDVHALKSHKAGACASAPASSPSGSVAGTSKTTASPPTGAPAGSTPAVRPTLATTQAVAGVAQAHMTSASPARTARAGSRAASGSGHGGVLGASKSKPITSTARPARAVVGKAQFTG